MIIMEATVVAEFWPLGYDAAMLREMTTFRGKLTASIVTIEI
jgi:hypothetical protein